ncbi:MAG: hypothetical protein KDD28_07620, partial [Phaeodactylibacter sp.]|nr:hypothetical protein [Phaeodactylibacter sp.]
RGWSAGAQGDGTRMPVQPDNFLCLCGKKAGAPLLPFTKKALMKPSGLYNNYNPMNISKMNLMVYSGSNSNGSSALFICCFDALMGE